MSDNYYLLVTFICSFCKDVMRNVFLHFEKADCHENDMCYTNLESYLHNRKSDITIMKTNGCLRLDQVNKILTVNGKTDIKLWDISMLIAAIENLFDSRLNMRDRNSILQIRQIRNLLIHIAHVDQITDDQFNNFWFTLRKATLKLARNIQGTKYEEEIAAKIDDAKKHRAYESFDTLREWFEETVTQLKDEFKNMRSEICSITNDNSSVKYQAEDVNAETNNQRTPRKRLRTETVTELASWSALEHIYSLYDSDSDNECIQTENPYFSVTWPETIDHCLQAIGADRMTGERIKTVEDVHVNAKTNNQRDYRKRLRTETVSERASSSTLDAKLNMQILYRRSDSRVEDPLVLRKIECANALRSKELTHDESELKNIGLESHLAKVETEEVAPKIRLHLEESYLSGSLAQLKSIWENVRTVEDAQALISDGQLPNEGELSDVVHRLGRKSDIVELLCKTICEKIASVSPNVVHVFAAYTLAHRDKLHFVVLLENGPSSDKDLNIDHEIVFRNCKGDEKTEHEHLEKETESELSAEESTALKNTINKVTKQYMENHKYLNAITARKISFEGNETMCIVMYVHPCTDRYSNIPYNEENIPATVEGYKVVVRNGVFKTATKTASECHDNVRMGCQITSNLVSGFGTLGGFIDHHEYGLCGFTCAHVVYGTEQMKCLKRKKRLKRSTEEDACLIYQPSTSSVPIGRVVEAFYTEGGDSESAGVDLALFQIEARPPVTGAFPRCNMDEELEYVSGKTWGRSRLNPGAREVYKFGVVTGITQGKVRFTNMSVRELNFVAKGYIDGVDTVLYNQYEIENDTINVCEQGDSGGLVFMKDCAGELICIGMVSGVLDMVNPLHGVVTPITDILRELNVQLLKPFRKQLTLDLLEKKLAENAAASRVQLRTVTTDLRSQIQGDLKSIQPYINERVSEIGQGIFTKVIEGLQTTINSQLQSSMISMQSHINDNVSKIMEGIQKTIEKEVKSTLIQYKTQNNNKENELRNCGDT